MERPIDSYTSSDSLAVDFLIGSPGYRVTTTRIDRPLMLSPLIVIMHKIYYIKYMLKKENTFIFPSLFLKY